MHRIGEYVDREPVFQDPEHPQDMRSRYRAIHHRIDTGAASN
jgi:hypothetical protein